MKRTLIGIFGFSMLSGCGAPRPASHSPPPASASADDEWAGSSWEDRHDTMTFLVLPSMARLFQRFDGARYPDLTCRRCHGADAETVNYAMPHGLSALDPAHLPKPSDADPRTAKVAKFMTEEVTPQMADLLGVRPYDPATGRGFSCFNCHARAD
jgi:hypothetical protein